MRRICNGEDEWIVASSATGFGRQRERSYKYPAEHAGHSEPKLRCSKDLAGEPGSCSTVFVGQWKWGSNEHHGQAIVTWVYVRCEDPTLRSRREHVSKGPPGPINDRSSAGGQQGAAGR